MPDSAQTPAAAKQTWIARGEQAALVLLAVAVVAGVAWRGISYWRVGTEPLEVAPPAAGPTYRVNINAADWVVLALVPGLGETLSKRIVETRQARGGRFQSLEDLKEVRGIGDKTLDRVRPYLFVGDPEAGPEPVTMPDVPPAP
jgi:competence protein ComEA